MGIYAVSSRVVAVIGYLREIVLLAICVGHHVNWGVLAYSVSECETKNGVTSVKITIIGYYCRICLEKSFIAGHSMCPRTMWGTVIHVFFCSRCNPIKNAIVSRAATHHMDIMV